MNKNKILIAYYSRNGENFVSGRVVNQERGSTEILALKIQKILRTDIFEISTAYPYPEEYREATSVAQKELSEHARPDLKDYLENISNYSTIFLGFPNWWGTMPMPVFTFLEHYDFSGKTIIPFCTHAGSGMGGSMKDIQNLCPDARVLDGLSVTGATVEKADNKLKHWLEECGRQLTFPEWIE